MPLVYVETTILSYLAAHLSRDLVMAAHQQVTQQWWRVARDTYTLAISQPVLDEIQAGDPDAAARRMQLAQGLAILSSNEDVESLDATYNRELALPPRARMDVSHLAYAVSHRVDFLATWNCAHLANGPVIRRLLEVNLRLGRPTPLIVTPEELLGAEDPPL